MSTVRSSCPQFCENKVLFDCIRVRNPGSMQKFSLLYELAAKNVPHVCESDKLLQNFNAVIAIVKT